MTAAASTEPATGEARERLPANGAPDAAAPPAAAPPDGVSEGMADRTTGGATGKAVDEPADGSADERTDESVDRTTDGAEGPVPDGADGNGRDERPEATADNVSAPAAAELPAAPEPVRRQETEPAPESGPEPEHEDGDGVVGAAAPPFPDVPASAEDEPAATTAPPALRFAATGLPVGCLRVDVDAGDTDPARASAFERAVRLAAAEPLCEALERWLGEPFDLEPEAEGSGEAKPAAGDGAEAAGGTLAVRLEHRGREDVPALTVHVAPSALASLPPVPDALAETVDVRFEPLAVELRVARVPLPETAFAALEVGAALLLPESFGASWAVQLAGDAGRVAATLEADDVAVAEGVGFGSGETGRRPPSISGGGGPIRHVEVSFDGALALDPGAVLCGRGCRVALPGTLAERPFALSLDGRVRFRGHLAPLGDGHAFFAREAMEG